MDVESLAKQLILQNMTPEQQLAVLDGIKASVAQAKEVQKRKIGENVDVVVQALKKIESDIRERYDAVGNAIEKRVLAIKDGRDGIDGKDGRDGKDGKPGKNGAVGPRGADGKDGRDGVNGSDGVSVTDARIDFDGSLIISLSSGREINVGEVVAPDLAERIKVITNGGGTSQSVLDTLTDLQNQIDNLIPSQTGNSGKYLTTDGTSLSWASIAGGGLNYKGTWNASTNTPTITSSVGTSGDYYVVSVSGSTNIDGITDWVVGDWIIYNGTFWQKIDQSEVGDVSGPGSSTDNAVARFNGTTGKVIQNSGIIIDDSDNVSNARSYAFSGSVPASTPIGTMWFDSSTDTLNFKQNNITQQIGEEIFIYGRASEAITNGQVVAVSGAYGTTGYVTFEPAPIGTTDPSHIIGLATEDIAKNSFGRITAFGIVHDLTTSPGFSDGDVLWYDPTVLGGYTKTQPSAPAIKVQIGVVTKAAGGTNGSIQVKIFSGPRINDVSDVQTSSSTGGQLLTYNQTSGYWKNTSLSAGTGISVGTTSGGGLTVTNSAPDQTVSLTGAGTTSVTGTYPNFTITSNDAYSGTVTSITAGTGLTGGTITTTGTVALATSGVTAGSYTATNITVDAYGRITSASNGTAGASLSNDTTTASNLYPMFASSTSGTPSTVYTSNSKLLYKPSTGELTASAPVAGNGIFINNTTVSSDYTIAAGTNGFSVGPVTVASGKAVTIESGQQWVVF